MRRGVVLMDVILAGVMLGVGLPRPKARGRSWRRG
jgi:hypothetical protein